MKMKATASTKANDLPCCQTSLTIPNYRQGMINWNFRGPIVKWMPGEIVCVQYILAVGGSMWTSSIGGPRRLDVLQLWFLFGRGLERIGMATSKRSHPTTKENPLSSSVEWSCIWLVCPTLAQEHASKLQLQKNWILQQVWQWDGSSLSEAIQQSLSTVPFYSLRSSRCYQPNCRLN